jgi:hypothetical protein
MRVLLHIALVYKVYKLQNKLRNMERIFKSLQFLS